MKTETHIVGRLNRDKGGSQEDDEVRSLQLQVRDPKKKKKQIRRLAKEAHELTEKLQGFQHEMEEFLNEVHWGNRSRDNRLKAVPAGRTTLPSLRGGPTISAARSMTFKATPPSTVAFGQRNRLP